MSECVILPVPALQDNYAYLLHDAASGEAAVIDPTVAEPVLAALAQRKWKATQILNTHHHGDHVGGNLELKQRLGCRVIGSSVDAARIPGLDVEVKDNDTATIGTIAVTVLQIPGHTRGHLAFWLREHDAVFTGDTLFTLGCGRVFEGTPHEMWESLCRLRELPGKTRVYCGHEYTQKNARFALTIDPDNAQLRARAKRTDTLRAAGKAL